LIISNILNILSALLSIYTILCFINIIMSWIPGAKFTQFGKAISSITDPYMNFFSFGGKLRVGNIDFSPIVSIGVLSLLSSILNGITSTGRIYLGGILATIIATIWDIFFMLLSILILLVFIRWIVLLVNHGQTSYDSGWNSVDTIINKFSYKIAGKIIRKPVNYQTTLLVTWIVLLMIIIAGNILLNSQYGVLTALCYRIPV